MSLAIVALLWRLAPTALSGEWDVVGYPVLANWDYRRPFWAYRLGTLVLPTLVAVIYVVLSMWGPLRQLRRQRTDQVKLADPSQARSGAQSSASVSGIADLTSTLVRLAAPAIFVVSVLVLARGGLNVRAFVAGAAYLAIVVVAGLAWVRVVPVPATTGLKAGFLERLSVVNGVAAAIAALLGVWVVSKNTTVTTAEGVTRAWPWLPLWVVLAGVVFVAGWTLRQIWKRRPGRSIERSLLLAILGSAAVFVSTTRVPYVAGTFQGYDDAMALVGAELLDKGLFPWRDFLFVHGLYFDGLVAKVGFVLYENTIWGSVAGLTLFLVPLGWTFLYLFALWVSKFNPWFAALVGVASITGFFLLEVRFMFVPLTLMMLGETLRRRSRIWCGGLVAVLFVQSVLVPETSFLAIPALLCVVAADLVHRKPGEKVWAALARSQWCLIAGLSVTAAWAIFLVPNNSLRSYIDYYLTFGPGHNVGNALPFRRPDLHMIDYVQFGVGAVLVMATIGLVTVRLWQRSDWSTIDWLIVAFAAFLAFYEEKALGRYDSPHIDQVYAMACMLIVLWLWKVLSTVDLSVSLGRRGAVASVNAVPVLLGVLIVANATSLVDTAKGLPRKYHAQIEWAASTFPRMGYTDPNYIDASELSRLDTIIRHYAGDDQPVFDMTNSLGQMYFLLGRQAGTRFIHVSMAMPSYSQQLLIDELKKSRPPVVIFDSTGMGLPTWDGVVNNIRHYEVSQYVLDNWVPTVRTEHTLIMVRPDLAGRGLPQLTPPLKHDELWFSGRDCEWGYTPAFLRTVPSGPTEMMRLEDLGSKIQVGISGWAAEPEADKAAKAVVVLSGQTVLATATPSTPRQDVAAALGRGALKSGFHVTATVSDIADLSVYLLGEDGRAFPLNGIEGAKLSSFTLPDGTVVKTAAEGRGFVDSIDKRPVTVRRIDLPPTANPTSWALATVSTSGAPLGLSRMTITDKLDMPGRTIHFTTPAAQGSSVSVRVGSCLAWHGFSPGQPLYLIQSGSVPATSVTFSGVEANS